MSSKFILLTFVFYSVLTFNITYIFNISNWSLKKIFTLLKQFNNIKTNVLFHLLEINTFKNSPLLLCECGALHFVLDWHKGKTQKVRIHSTIPRMQTGCFQKKNGKKKYHRKKKRSNTSSCCLRHLTGLWQFTILSSSVPSVLMLLLIFLCFSWAIHLTITEHSILRVVQRHFFH